VTWQPNPNPKAPDFEPGNELALKHGAYSPRAIGERAELVHAELLEHAPYLDEERFIPAVQRYLAAAAREALLDEHIRKVCDEKGPGAVPARSWEQVTACARLAAKLGSDLGLDPIGHAKIRALSVGAQATEATLADLAAAGRQTKGYRAMIGAQADADAAGITEAEDADP